MKNFLLFLLCNTLLIAYSSAFAGNSSALGTQEKVTKQDKENTFTGKVDKNEDKIIDNKDEKTEQKNGTGVTKNEEKAVIVKNLNSILIDAYKAKFAKILTDLNENIKGKKKDEKLKIFSTVIVSISEKIKLINSEKIDISENRKEVLIAVLKYIKQDVELKIQAISKEK